MPVLLVDALCAVQEVVLQAAQQVFGKVCPRFLTIAMLTYLTELFLQDRFVTAITEMNGAFLKPTRRPTDRVDEPAPMGMVVAVTGAAIVLTGDLIQERIDDRFGHCRATMYFFCCHCFGVLLTGGVCLGPNQGML